MAWIALVLAGACEVLGVLAIKMVTRKKNLLSYLFLAVAFGTSFSLLSYAMTVIPMGTAYAIWTGIGTAGSAILGMLAFGESREWKRFLFISMILTAAVGLKLLTP
jgi:paired small multidrug resistance pump